MTLHFLNDVVNVDTKIDDNLIIASLNSESSKPRDSTSVLKALPSKLDIKRHSPSII